MGWDISDFVFKEALLRCKVASRASTITHFYSLGPTVDKDILFVMYIT